jgi:hypothetical protein
MDLAPYVTNLSRALAAAGTAGGEDAEAFLERFAIPLESAIRLSLLEVVSAAAEEISTELPGGSVDVRLHGSNPGFRVATDSRPAAADRPGAAAEPEPEAAPQEEGPLARITVRMPERMKLQVDEAAGQEGVSTNAWLVRATSSALRTARRTGAGGTRGPRIDERHQGWLR